MGITIDLQRRILEANVRALAEREGPPGSVGARAALRAELGAEVHRRVRAQAAAHLPGYRGEVAVSLSTEVDGFSATVRGRIDGLYEREGDVVVEEVKSSTHDGAAIERIATEAWPAAIAQVRLYALALRRGGEARSIATRLRIVSLVDGTEHLRDVALDPEAVVAWLEATLRAVIAEARARRDRHAALSVWAEGLRFPHARPRPHQPALVDALAEGLELERPIVLHAPTGLGKTACAMLPALRYALLRDARLVWLTAKTPQQALAARTFRRLVEADPPEVPLHAVTLRAKGTMCGPSVARCRPLSCPYLHDFEARLVTTDALASLRTRAVHVEPDAIARFGRAHELCPWELSLRLADAADVVIGDVNYAFDPVAALGLLRTRPRVVVIDEAHNLPERARAQDSPFLPRIALVEARSAARGDPTDPGLGDELSGFLASLQAWADAHARRVADEELVGVRGCVPVEVDRAGLEELLVAGRVLELRHFRLRLRRDPEREDDPIADVFDRVRRIAGALATSRVVPYVADTTAQSGRGIGLVCVDASPRLASVHAEARGTIAMSATMGPLHHAARELGLAALHPIRLAVPSPFPRAHRRVVAVTDVDTSLAGRANAYDRIARHIEAVVGVRAGNYVAFFPSFAFLAEVRRRLAIPRERVLVQLPGMPPSDRARTLASLHDGGAPRLLLAVSGGAFAEGIDLPGEALVGAIVVGPAVPTVDFARELRRAHLDDDGDDGFTAAYALPAIERVVQAGGRVIRSMRDRGVIVLLGRRFGEPGWHDLLPDDWRGDPAGPLVVDDLVGALERFWRDRNP